MTDRCSSCGRLLLWSAGRLMCANVNCTTGHQPGGQLRLEDDDDTQTPRQSPARAEKNSRSSRQRIFSRQERRGCGAAGAVRDRVPPPCGLDFSQRSAPVRPPGPLTTSPSFGPVVVCDGSSKADPRRQLATRNRPDKSSSTRGVPMHVATRRFHARDAGDDVIVDAGEFITSDHDLVRRYPDCFEPESDHRRRESIRSLAQDSRNREDGATFIGSRPRVADDASPAHARQARDGAMRTLERHYEAGTLSDEACRRVDGVVDGPDAPFGLDAAYIETHGSEHYERAFHKLLRYGDGAAMRMTKDEMDAVQHASHAEQTRAAMAESVGATGGFGIPISIDPTINLSSNGAINPIRQLATVRTMSTRELRLVSSDGVVAQYQAEAAEAIDNSPTLAQPTLTASRCTSFVPFSFEVGDDWSSLVTELTQCIADAKDVVEATKFLLGTGTNEPWGVLNIGAGGLTTTQRVLSAGAGAVVIADVYALKQALGQTRWASSATWALNPTRLDAVYRLTPSGSTTEPQIMTDRNGPLLGRPTAEWSTMATAVTTGSKWAIYGDFKAACVIGDRLGMSLEIIPHLFGSGSRYPTGQRGAYAFWRNDGRVKVANALRYGETS